MFGIVIEYQYSGDESKWREAIDNFISQINADDKLKGRFSYQVNVSKDGESRIHIGQWDEEETLTYLQSQPFFSEFSGKVKEFAGGVPKNTGFKNITSTG